MEDNLPKVDLALGEIFSKYRDYLKSSGYSNPTVKNYLSDLRHLIAWINERYSGFSFVFLTLPSVRAYRSFVKEKFRSKPSISARRLSSLRKFLSWAGNLKYVPEDLVKATEYILSDKEAPTTLPQPQIIFQGPSTELKDETKTPPVPDKIHQKHHIKYTRPLWYQRYHEHPAHRVIHFSILGVFLLLLANLMFGQLIGDLLKRETAPDLGNVLAATPPRILSFQGRLTDENDVPVSTATNIVFRIWDDDLDSTEVDCDGGGDEDCMWKSKTWSVTPDQNGIFSVLLGDTSQSDTTIPASLFSDNASLWLGVKVESDSEMTPRQRIASSTYALNADALDGVDSVSFLRSDASDNYTSGTLTIDDGTTFAVNSTTIGIGNASSDAATINATSTFNTDVNLSLASTEDLVITNTNWAPASGIGLVDVNATSSTNDARGVDNYFDLNSTGSVTQYGYYGNFDATSVALADDTTSNYYGIYQTVSKTGTDTAATTATTTGTYGIRASASNTSGTNDAEITRKTYGGYFSAENNGTGNGQAYGIYSTVSGNDDSSESDFAYAGYFNGALNTTYNVGVASGTGCYINICDAVTSNPTDIAGQGFFGAGRLTAFSAKVDINHSFTTDSAIGLLVNTGTKTSGTVTNNYGIKVENQTYGSTDYGLYIAGAEDYAIYTAADDIKFVQAAADSLTIDAGTTDKTQDAISLDVDVNSTNVAGMFVDLDVGTALSSGEIADGLKVDVAGNASDNAAAAVNGLRLKGATASGAPVTGVNIETAFDVDIDLQNDEQILNTADDEIEFQCAPAGSCTASNDLRFDLDGTNPVIDSPTDTIIQINDTLMIDLAGNASDEAICGDNAEDDTTDVMVNDCTTGSTEDYAEFYSVEPNTTYGHIVSAGDEYITTTKHKLDPQTHTFVKLVKAQKGSNRTMIGIVSNNYSDFSVTGDRIKPEDNPFPIALNGRVPVFVTDENGSIEVGDRITSSSTPGVGMKVDDQTEQTIGIALSAFDERGQGSIIVFVNIGWNFIDLDQETRIKNQITEYLTGIDHLNMKNLKAETISIGENKISLDDEGNLRVDGNLVAKGDVKIEGNLTLDGSFSAKEIKTEKLGLGEKSTGTATLRKGETRVEIEASEISENSLVFITPTSRTYDVLTVIEKKPGEGFVVEDYFPAEEDIHFNWFFVN
ncbi:MAG: site-specific integrase [Candidatus Woykebacteria bacterium]